MSRHSHWPRLSLPVLLTLICGFLGGCDLCARWEYSDFEAHVERLREIDTLDMESVSTPADHPEAESQPAAETPPEEVQLTLGQCRAYALAGNLALQVELLDATIAAQSITEAEAAFEAIFLVDVAHMKTDTPTGTALTGSSVEHLEAYPRLRIPLRTGGSVVVGQPSDRLDTDNAFATLNPAYTSDLNFTIQQPLLRGAGVRTNTHPIRIARLQHQQSEAATKLSVIGVLAAVERVYWILGAVRQELEVRKQEHDLAKSQLERARRQVAAGVKAESEIVRAELGVADTLQAIILAENAVRDRQRDLKRLLQKAGLGMQTPTVIVPTSEPAIRPFRVDAQHVVDLAMRNRMELLELELQIAADASTIDFERNHTLPLVALEYTYNINGLGESCHDSYDLMFDKRFEDHRLGLHVEIPIGNQAARSRLRRAILTRIRRLATRKDREELIRQEVYSVIDQLDANWQRILAARQTVVHAKRVLEAEQRQFDQGLRTSTEVLEAQAAHADAQSSLIRAMSEYQIAQVDLAVATGTLLGAARIRWEPTAPAEIEGK